MAKKKSREPGDRKKRTSRRTEADASLFFYALTAPDDTEFKKYAEKKGKAAAPVTEKPAAEAAVPETIAAKEPVPEAAAAEEPVSGATVEETTATEESAEEAAAPAATTAVGASSNTQQTKRETRTERKEREKRERKEIQRARRKKERLPKKILKGVLSAILILIIAVVAYAGIYVFNIIHNLPKHDPATIQDDLKSVSTIYDDQGSEMQDIYLGDNYRMIVNYNDIPTNLVNAAVSIEDKTFWTNNGFNFTRIV
ncbi:MAG: transglycosylase domain-containing protein, partial [Clostridiales bacterium]|nr:transglycosylase domain-containing protein [Clostridiales bacterium]